MRQENELKNYSLIQLSKITIQKLKSKKITKLETYDEIVNRLIP